MNHVAAPARTPQQEVAGRLLRHTAAAVPGAAPSEEAAWSADFAGPVTARLPDERAVQAACGLMHVHGRAAGRPLPLAVDYAATAAGILAAQGVCAVLLARHRGLALGRVRTSAAQAALLALTQYLAAAGAAATSGAADADVPGTAVLVSADGAAVEVETLDPGAWREFWEHLGAASSLAGRGWAPFQQRFATATCALPPELRESARAVPLARLREAAARSGVSLALLDDDPGPPVRPAPWELTPGPGSGPALSAARGPLPLEGIRVVEATRRVQGPLAGHVLRLLGADVLRVEPPGGDPMRGLPPLTAGCSARFLALNAGKPVAEADITTADGRRAVRELVAGADVFLHNWAPGKAARLGLDAPGLWRVRPGLVHAEASGFGDAFARPPVGTDYLAQVHSGLAAALRPAGDLPAPSLMTLTDVLGGLVCAHGIVAGLLLRARTGRGARIGSSLFSAAALVPRPSPRAVWTPLDVPLRTADGHLYLDGAGRADPARVARVTGAPGGPEATAARFAHRPTGDWTVRLAEAGITATPVCTDLAGLPGDPDFARALVPADTDRPARPRSPWEFS